MFPDHLVSKKDLFQKQKIEKWQNIKFFGNIWNRISIFVNIEIFKKKLFVVLLVNSRYIKFLGANLQMYNLKHIWQITPLFCTQVYRSSSGLKSFDFLSTDCSTLLLGEWNGDVAVVDRRTE